MKMENKNKKCKRRKDKDGEVHEKRGEKHKH
jgi:hypothetical protein